MNYTRWLFCFALTSMAHTLAETPVNNGVMVTTGLGFSPIYIEEIITDSALSAGATVTPIHSTLRVGYPLFNDYSASLMAEHNVYLDGDSNIYISGVSGLAASYYIPDFYQIALTAGAGLATKHIIGESLSATGVGYFLGLSKRVSDTLFAEAGYSFLSLESVASTIANGDTETISTIHVSLSYLWK